MIHEKSIATFLERHVVFTEIESIGLAAFSLPYRLSSSTVLLYFGKVLLDDADTGRLLEWLLSQKPLAITVAGKYADKYFDVLLEVQSRSNSDAHTMTYLTVEEDLSEIVWEFLNTSFPDDERFDDWKEYVVLSFEREKPSRHSLVDAIESIAEKH